MGAAEDLISDLLDISRLESGKIDLHPHSFAIMDVLSNLNAEFSALAAKQGVQFSLVPSLLWVHSDPKLLRRVIQNFLTNAFRYNPNGKVILGVRRVATGQVRIDVWDNGIGIEQDKQQEILRSLTAVAGTLRPRSRAWAGDFERDCPCTGSSHFDALLAGAGQCFLDYFRSRSTHAVVTHSDGCDGQ